MRPIYFIMYFRSIRNSVIGYMKTLYKSFAILFLIFMNLVFFACVGLVIFRGKK